MNEIWRTSVYDGEIYEELYKVSNLGRILSLDYRRTGKAELMNPFEMPNGYFQVCLSKNGGKWFSLHRVVAETFIPNPENKPQVNHKIEGDKGKTINMVFFNDDGSINKEKTTIEWCDGKYNHNYGTINQRISKANTNGKCSKPVLQFTIDGEFVREWESTHECERNGFDHGNVSKCCRGKQKSAYGYKWHYV